MNEKPEKSMQIDLKEAEEIRVLHSEDIFDIMQKVLKRESKLDKDKRHFWAIGLDIRSKVILIELVSLGTMAKKDLHASDIYANAIHKQAKRVILCHNSPDGSLQANEEAKDLTDWLIQVGLIVNIPVYDHLIMTEKSYVSFKGTGLLAELEKSKKYVIPMELERRAREEEKLKAQIELDHVKQQASEEMLEKVGQTRFDIALSLKEKGISIEIISSTTGLTEQEIKQL
jgi:DNA repair protein RadC